MTRSLRRSALFLMLLPLLAAPLAAASQWVPLGPFGGTITRLAGDPVDSRVVYATLVYATTYWENALFK
ncbi:MAG TPA: hypothetical protein VLR69_07845, partial [Thermoanaerobaculia bacterium]|nr:hypothetical protein [Thermoanaerobaculia bacterium]